MRTIAVTNRRNNRSVKWKKFFEKQRELHREIRQEAGDILQSKNFARSSQFVQHGSMTVKNHSMNVAKYSLAISKKLPFEVNR